MELEKLEKFLEKQIVNTPGFRGIEVDTVGDLKKLAKKLIKVFNSNIDSTYNFDPLDFEGDHAGDNYISESLDYLADNIENNLIEGHDVKVTVEIFKRKGRPAE